MKVMVGLVEGDGDGDSGKLGRGGSDGRMGVRHSAFPKVSEVALNTYMHI